MLSLHALIICQAKLFIENNTPPKVDLVFKKKLPLGFLVLLDLWRLVNPLGWRSIKYFLTTSLRSELQGVLHWLWPLTLCTCGWAVYTTPPSMAVGAIAFHFRLFPYKQQYKISAGILLSFLGDQVHLRAFMVKDPCYTPPPGIIHLFRNHILQFCNCYTNPAIKRPLWI